MGAAACIVVPSFWSRFRGQGDWQKLAWWIHHHLPYHWLTFFRTRFAFNIGWHEADQLARVIDAIETKRDVEDLVDVLLDEDDE